MHHRDKARAITQTRTVFAAHLATAAATESLQHRQQTGKLSTGESAAGDAIERYASTAYHIIAETSLTAVNCLLNRDLDQAPDEPPRDVSRLPAPRRRDVLAAMKYALDALTAAHAVLVEPPALDATVDMRHPVTVATGQWSIAYSAYRRSLGKQPPPLTIDDATRQAAGLIHALTPRIPALRDTTTPIANYRPAFALIVALASLDDIPVTTVERDTIIELLAAFNMLTDEPTITKHLKIMSA